ncbi:hypothetical protein [Kaistia terrae]|uniref:Uncharacterized protein n=1 Tax=Kaistia terrae TaxID=537017 RepID=A0ABW0Q158_9HYPH|nr:hypothetical protein [Kaistia terrae]MCX5578969.1 hypothetical protein [Kaistia terrae]
MKIYVQFQEFSAKTGRPIDHPSVSDFETTDAGFALIPNVGDFVELVRMGSKDPAAYSGRVKSRLFRYFEQDSCGITIVVENADDADWGALIKE